MGVNLDFLECVCAESYLHEEIKNMQKIAFSEDFTKECPDVELFYTTLRALSKIQVCLIEVLEDAKNS